MCMHGSLVAEKTARSTLNVLSRSNTARNKEVNKQTEERSTKACK